MLATFGTMALLRRVDQEEPIVLFYTRFFFIAYILLSTFLHIILQALIIYRRDQTKIQVPKSTAPTSLGEAMAAAEKKFNDEQEKQKKEDDKDDNTDESKDETNGENNDETEQSETAKPEEPKMETVTIMDYDLAQLAKTRKSFITNACILAAIHYKMQSVSPLVISAVTGLVRLLTDDPLVAIHFLKSAPVGPLARPFKQPEGLLGTMFKGMTPPQPTNNPSQPFEELHDDGDEDDDDDQGPTTLNDMDDSNITSDFTNEEAKKDK